MLSVGIEPTLRPPQGRVLSIERRELCVWRIAQKLDFCERKEKTPLEAGSLLFSSCEALREPRFHTGGFVFRNGAMLCGFVYRLVELVEGRDCILTLCFFELFDGVVDRLLFAQVKNTPAKRCAMSFFGVLCPCHIGGKLP